MNKCYVCLESCEEKSPCYCEMPIHKECLTDVRRKIPSTTCTICKSPIQVQPFEIIIDPPDVYEQVNNSKDDVIVSICIIINSALIYLFTGWVGKLCLYLIGIQTDILCFWSVDHIFASMGMLMIFVGISKIFCNSNRD